MGLPPKSIIRSLRTEMKDFAYKSMPRLYAQLCVVVNEFCMHLCVGFCMQSQYVICMQILYGGWSTDELDLT